MKSIFYKSFQEAVAFARKNKCSLSRKGDEWEVKVNDSQNNLELKKVSDYVTEFDPNTRFCEECGKIIPKERVQISNATRCIDCQKSFEKNHDTRPKISEGLPGSREGNKRMRGQIWGEIKKRNSGN